MLVCVVAACVGGGYALARQSALLLLQVFENPLLETHSSTTYPFITANTLFNHDCASCHTNLLFNNSLQGGIRRNYLPLKFAPRIT